MFLMHTDSVLFGVARYHGFGHLSPMENPEFIAARILAMKEAGTSSAAWLEVPRVQEFGHHQSLL